MTGALADPRPAEERRMALALAAELGPAEAARRLGIPASTVGSWVRRDKAATTAALAKVGVSAERVTSADLDDVAARALAAVDEAIAAGKANDARNWAVTAAIVIDKAQLLRVEEGRHRPSASPVYEVAAEPLDIDAKAAAVRAQRDRARAELDGRTW